MLKGKQGGAYALSSGFTFMTFLGIDVVALSLFWVATAK
jgi:hypothetical protein